MLNKLKILPKSMLLPFIIAILCNIIAYNGTRVFTSKRLHFDLSNSLDNQIPFISWTVIIYIGCYAFWIVNYLLGCRQEEKKAFQFMSADLVAKVVCMLFFLLVPTTNVRPIIDEKSIWDTVMIWLYKIDAADNLLPSIHCLTSWLCVIAVRENNKISKGYKFISCLFAVAVCISTLTTKQHVLIDVVLGVILAEASYWFVEKSGFILWYRKYITKINNRIMDRRKGYE